VERKLISMAANGATAGKIAARFRTTVDTIQAEGEITAHSIKSQTEMAIC
jgi:hypothetical protein